MGRDGTPAREISFVSLVAYGPKVSDSALTMGVTASETRQGSSQQKTGLHLKRDGGECHIEIINQTPGERRGPEHFR